MLNLLFIILSVKPTLSVCPPYNIANITHFEPAHHAAIYHFPSVKHPQIYQPKNIPRMPCFPETGSRYKRRWVSEKPLNLTADGHYAYFKYNVSSFPDLLNFPPFCYLLNEKNETCFRSHTMEVHKIDMRFRDRSDEVFKVCLNRRWAIHYIDIAPEEQKFFPADQIDKLYCYPGPNGKPIFDYMFFDNPGTFCGANCSIEKGRQHIFYDLPGHSFGFFYENCDLHLDYIIFPPDGRQFHLIRYDYSNNVTYGYINYHLCKKYRKGGHFLIRNHEGKWATDDEIYYPLPGRHNFTCEVEFVDNTTVHFSTIVYAHPNINVKLENCQNYENKCRFHFDFHPGFGMEPIIIRWYFNGEEIIDAAEFSPDRKDMFYNVTKNGNVQAFIITDFGTQMTHSYVRFTYHPTFESDLPTKLTLNSTVDYLTLVGIIDFQAFEEPDIWWTKNGERVEDDYKDGLMKLSVDIDNNTCTVLFSHDHSTTGSLTLQCIYQVGPYIIYSNELEVAYYMSAINYYKPLIYALLVICLLVLVAIILILVRKKKSKIKDCDESFDSGYY